MAKKKVEKAGDGAMQAAKNKGKEIDPARVFAEKVRDHKELETRWAVLQEARVEYFRGKDFITLLRAHPELIKPLGIEAAIEDVELDIGNILIRRKLIVRCDRVTKTPRPGKTKLSKWPARIEIFPEQLFTEKDAFFAWTFERRRPLWQTILSFLVPIVTLACCLFPVFPHWCKLGVLYFCLAFLSLVFGLLILRGVIFGIVWLVCGKRVWFFPNILEEPDKFSELFQFLPDLSKDDDPPPKWSTRLAFGAATGLIIWFVVVHGPNEAARARYQRRASNVIDDVLNWKPQALSVFTGQAEGGESVFNETLVNGTEAADSHNAGKQSPSSVPDTQSGEEAQDRVVDPLLEDSNGEEDSRESVPLAAEHSQELNEELK